MIRAIQVFCFSLDMKEKLSNIHYMPCTWFTSYLLVRIKYQTKDTCTTTVQEESTAATGANCLAESSKNYIQQLRLAFTSPQAYALQYYLGSGRKDQYLKVRGL